MSRVILLARPTSKPAAWWPRDAEKQPCWVTVDENGGYVVGTHEDSAMEKRIVRFVKKDWMEVHENKGREWEFREEKAE